MPSSLKEAIIKMRKSGKIPIIGEIKLYSPKEGDLIKGRNPLTLAGEMAECGVVGLSIVTEPEHFKGNLKILQEVVHSFPIPVLRKDFIDSEQQIYETAGAGASAVLLIASKTPLKLLKKLHRLSHQLGLETVVEVHTAEEMQAIQGLALDMVGINNKNILQLEKDAGEVSTTEKLAPLAPKDAVVISESGFSVPDDVARAIKSGAQAVLVGTALLKADNLKEKLSSLMGDLSECHQG